MSEDKSTATLMDGSAIAAQIFEEVAARAATLTERLGRRPCLAAVP